MIVQEEQPKEWSLKAYIIFIMLLYFQMLQRLISSVTVHDLIMNPEMNNKDRKKHSKTIAMASIGFLLIAAAFTIPFASSGTRLVSAQQGGNTTTIVATPFDTFTASGIITATVGQQGGGNQSAGGGATSGSSQTGGGQQSPYILGGNWNINVQSGNVTNFAANFVMVHTDGTEYHVHNITDFSAGNKTIQLIQGQELSINGTADYAVNGTTKWPGVDTTLTLSDNAAVMTIMPAAEDTDNHFQGQPIYGIVSQATGENGTTILQTTPPGQTAAQQGGEGGNQTQGGGPLESITRPLQDLFGGGQ